MQTEPLSSIAFMGARVGSQVCANCKASLDASAGRCPACGADQASKNPPRSWAARHAWHLIATLTPVSVAVIFAVYVLSSGIIAGCGCHDVPIVSWSTPKPSVGVGTGWEFQVANISRNEPLQLYYVHIDGWTGVPSIGPSSLFSRSNESRTIVLGAADALHLDFTDHDARDYLSSGDTFFLENTDLGKTYVVTLTWGATGSRVSEIAINT